MGERAGISSRQKHPVSPANRIISGYSFRNESVVLLYVANFNNFNKTYGSLGAVAILLMWFYLTAYVILLSAETNVEAERQTIADTTKGHPEPMGRRGAFAADHPA